MFYSSLTNKNISDNKYEHVFKVWNKFKMKNVKGYHNLYLKFNVFEKFRKINLKIYRLCMTHCFSKPSLSWDAVVKMKKVEFEHVPDAEMHLLLDKVMKNEGCYVSKRYNKAKNKFLKSYNPKQESKHITYLDRNNLYGCEMSKFLPNGFKLIDRKEVDLKKYTGNNSEGRVFEIDLKYPEELYNLHNGYPL